MPAVTTRSLLRPISRLPSPPGGRHHRLDTEDVERPPQIIDERGQTELGADIVEALHQKAPWFIHCLIEPKGCSTISRRRSRISGRAFSRAAMRSSTASFSRRETLR